MRIVYANFNDVSNRDRPAAEAGGLTDGLDGWWGGRGVLQ
jgi:hypothetical protein